MPDFYEVDFLPVHTSKSGDAITLRYTVNGIPHIHVVDGGYLSTAEAVTSHLNTHYGRNPYIDHMVVTHPDQDHAEGLQAILEGFRVGALWMLCPWHYVDELIERFARYENLDNLKKKLREAYPYTAKLEEIARQRGVPIYAPLQGAAIGAFHVLAPSRSRALERDRFRLVCIQRGEGICCTPRGRRRRGGSRCGSGRRRWSVRRRGAGGS